MHVLSLFKASYALYFSSLACVHPFLALILKQHGLTPGQVGAALLIKPLSGIAGGTLLCGFADQHQCHRVVLSLSVAVSAACIQGLWWVPGGLGLAWVLALFFGIGFFSAPVSSIVDSLCSHCIEESSCQETYGQQRLWGAVGWGLFALVASGVFYGLDGPARLARLAQEYPLIFARFQPGLTDLADSSWWPAFVLHALLTLGTVVVCDRLAANVMFRERGVGGGNRELAVELPFREKLAALQSEGASVGTFLLLCVVFGLQTGCIEGWLFVVLSSAMRHATETLYGLSLSVTCIAESLVFAKSTEIREWIERGVGVVNACFMAFAMRLGAYTLGAWLGANAWCVLLIEPLHGLTFALTWLWLVEHAKIYGAAAKLESFTVAVATLAMFNLGYGVGGELAGVAFGVSPLLTFAPTLSILLLAWAGHAWSGRRSRSRTALKAKLSGILHVDDDEFEHIELTSRDM